MLSFLTKFAAVVRGVLCGFDRLFFCGTLRGLSYAKLAAAATLASLPVLLAGWIAQKQLIRGLTMGAVK